MHYSTDKTVHTMDFVSALAAKANFYYTFLKSERKEGNVLFNDPSWMENYTLCIKGMRSSSMVECACGSSDQPLMVDPLSYGMVHIRYLCCQSEGMAQ